MGYEMQRTALYVSAQPVQAAKVDVPNLRSLRTCTQSADSNELNENGIRVLEII
jgi:hypothetical protein